MLFKIHHNSFVKKKGSNFFDWKQSQLKAWTLFAKINRPLIKSPFLIKKNTGFYVSKKKVSKKSQKNTLFSEFGHQKNTFFLMFFSGVQKKSYKRAVLHWMQISCFSGAFLKNHTSSNILPKFRNLKSANFTIFSLSSSQR